MLSTKIATLETSIAELSRQIAALRKTEALTLEHTKADLGAVIVVTKNVVTFSLRKAAIEHIYTLDHLRTLVSKLEKLQASA